MRMKTWEEMCRSVNDLELKQPYQQRVETLKET